jgi:hypothetical protein
MYWRPGLVQEEKYDGVKPIDDTPKLLLRVIYRSPVITDNEQQDDIYNIWDQRSSLVLLILLELLTNPV